MKETYVRDITGRFSGQFLVQGAEKKETKTGKPYVAMTLIDKTGKMPAKFWDCTEPPANGSVVYVSGARSDYQGKAQVVLESMASCMEFDSADFLPEGPEREKYKHIVLSKIDSILDPTLSWLCVGAMEAFSDEFFQAPAAKTNHQPYVGGLAEHVARMMLVADSLCGIYSWLDRDVMLAACLWHDIGKIKELKYATEIDYTLGGTLIGHINIGMGMLSQIVREVKNKYPNVDIDPSKLQHLGHLILSHHGKKEWGSPVTPATPEAHMFHQIDMVDSRAGGLEQAFELEVNESGFTAWNKTTDGPVFLGYRKQQ
jgi:3'-5' exoribonuclease